MGHMPESKGHMPDLSRKGIIYCCNSQGAPVLGIELKITEVLGTPSFLIKTNSGVKMVSSNLPPKAFASKHDITERLKALYYKYGSKWQNALYEKMSREGFTVMEVPHDCIDYVKEFYIEHYAESQFQHWNMYGERLVQ